MKLQKLNQNLAMIQKSRNDFAETQTLNFEPKLNNLLFCLT